MILPELYLDEDIQSDSLITALRSRGAIVLSTSEARLSHNSDQDQLHFAASKNRVLVTCNIQDFVILHKQWIQSDLHHSGIILIHQQKWGPGELARKIIRLLSALHGKQMRDRIEFISNW